jgi:heme/copper-type cytochrome/quinol oxidase subunit 2
MNPTRRVIAATQALLIFPASLFMGALILRQMSPLQHEPAYTSQQIVTWYSGRMWTLWVLLITLPLAVVVTGCLTFLRSWSKDRELPRNTQEWAAAILADPVMLFVGALTLTAGVVLAIVAVHMAAN